MEPILQQLQLTFRYAVYFTTDVFHPDNPVLREAIGRMTRAVFVVDSGVANAHPGIVSAIEAYCAPSAPVLIVPGGESAKSSPAVVENILGLIHAGAICRQSCLVAIGGGAVLDAAGYAAATAHRGVRLIRIPTTVLAQDDAGLGVKNGINYFGRKNYLGTFAPPVAVINDSHFLTTLDNRDWLSGLSEAVKVALIKDAAFFQTLEQDADALVARDADAMRRTIRRCAELHLAHISGGGDPFELGTSRPLDFGHWAAHKLEQMTGHRLRHGEAVAIGIALDSTYSMLAALLPERDWSRIIQLLARLRLPLFVPELSLRDEVLNGLNEFQEHLGGELTIAMLSAIGQRIDVHRIDRSLMVAAIEQLSNFADDSPGARALSAFSTDRSPALY